MRVVWTIFGHARDVYDKLEDGGKVAVVKFDAYGRVTISLMKRGRVNKALQVEPMDDCHLFLPSAMSPS